MASDDWIARDTAVVWHGFTQMATYGDNRPVIVELSSKDVIHSFGIPAMRVKQDVIPGLRTPVWFTPTMAGDFEVACSQLCGAGHYRMRAVITVESDDAFRKFLADEAARQVGR